MAIDIIDVTDPDRLLKRIQELVKNENVRITQHAHQEMAEENITYEEVLETIMGGKILENHPEHRRGACCLLMDVQKQVGHCTLFVLQTGHF